VYVFKDEKIDSFFHSNECTSSPKYIGAGTEALTLVAHARVRNLLPNLDSKPCAVFFISSIDEPSVQGDRTLDFSSNVEIVRSLV
jgi:hypothetical protein